LRPDDAHGPRPSCSLSMAGYDKLDITSVDHPKEDYTATLVQPVAGFRLGIPAYFYDHLDAEVARSVQEALSVLVKLTKSTKDIILPAFTHVGNVGPAGEIYAYHEEYFKRAAQRYMLPVRRRLEAASKSTVTAADCARVNLRTTSSTRILGSRAKTFRRACAMQKAGSRMRRATMAVSEASGPNGIT